MWDPEIAMRRRDHGLSLQRQDIVPSREHKAHLRNGSPEGDSESTAFFKTKTYGDATGAGNASSGYDNNFLRLGYSKRYFGESTSRMGVGTSCIELKSHRHCGEGEASSRTNCLIVCFWPRRVHHVIRVHHLNFMIKS